MSPLFVFKKVLVLSLQQPTLIPQQGSEIWASSQDLLEIQNLGNRWLLQGKKSGLALVRGLPNKLEKVLILSPENYEALQKCNSLNLDIGLEGLEATELGIPYLQSLLQCGFQGLGLSPNLRRLWETFRPTLLEGIQETPLMREALNFELSGVGVFSFRSTKNESKGKLQILKKVLQNKLGPHSLFFRFQWLEQPVSKTLIYRLTLFEFSRQKMEALGLDWPKSIPIINLEGPPKTFKGKNGSPLQLGADFGESQGLGKVLAQPRLRTTIGEEANFQSGGQIPILMKEQSGDDSKKLVEWKNYGLIIQLKTLPTTEPGAPIIDVNFEAELSEPDFGGALNGMPGFRTRKLKSRFELRCEEETILTSLIQSRTGLQEESPMGLPRIPILGKLFVKSQEQGSQNELWFSIRPTWEEISL